MPAEPEKAVKLSKAEKRLRRKAAKDEKRFVKQAEKAKTAKIVSQIEVPEVSKEAASDRPLPRAEKKLEWSRAMEDRDGAWSWGTNRDWGDDVWTGIINPHLTHYATKKWVEIESERTKKGAKHVEYEVSIICKEAYERLKHLKYDDQTHIFRFRLDGKTRLYGFRIEQTFNTVWYDPDHKIYPTPIQDRGKIRLKQQRKAAAKARARAA